MINKPERANENPDSEPEFEVEAQEEKNVFSRTALVTLKIAHSEQKHTITFQVRDTKTAGPPESGAINSLIITLTSEHGFSLRFWSGNRGEVVGAGAELDPEQAELEKNFLNEIADRILKEIGDRSWRDVVGSGTTVQLPKLLGMFGRNDS